MEYVGHKDIKKLCNFYVSDLHLSVMLIPYLSKQVNEDVEITTIFENINKENIEEVLEKLNIKNKEKILKINWSNNDTKDNINKMLDNNIKGNKKNTIIIGGRKNFIEKYNNKIKDYLKSKGNYNVKIINCYNVNEVGKDMKSIIKGYDGILNTSGEIAI